MPAHKPKVSIVIPAYKESRTIEDTILRVRKYIKRWSAKHGEAEVIIAVGTSPDDTLEKARRLTANLEGFRTIDAGLPHDKGHVVKVGMLKATGEYRLYMDADLATPLHHLNKAVRLLSKYDVVNGQRMIYTIHTGVRKFISITGNRLVRYILLPGFPDTQCGFKGFREHLAEKVFRQQTIVSWGFDMEILALARKEHARISHLLIADWQEKEGGTLNENPYKAMKAAAMTFFDLLKIRMHLLFGYYNQR